MTAKVMGYLLENVPAVAIGALCSQNHGGEDDSNEKEQ